MDIVDMHCDTISRLLRLRDAEEQGEQEGLWENSGHLDLLRMRQNRYLLQNFALFVNLRQCRNPWEEVCRLARLYQEELQKNAAYIGSALCYKDIERNRKEGRISALLTVEEGGVCQGRIERLQTLHEMGVRMMTLTWNYPNELGTPAVGASGVSGAPDLPSASSAWGAPNSPGVSSVLGAPDSPGNSSAAGLTPLGAEFVEQMEKLGILVDVSHLSDAGFYDLATIARKPFVASHSNARVICGHKRNLTDDMIRLIGERGGRVGLNLYQPFLLRSTGLRDVRYQKEQLIEAAVTQIKHIVRVGGESVLGLGSDFDGFEEGREYWGASCIKDIAGELRKEGFSERQVEGFVGGNVLQFYRENLDEGFDTALPFQ